MVIFVMTGRQAAIRPSKRLLEFVRSTTARVSGTSVIWMNVK